MKNYLLKLLLITNAVLMCGSLANAQRHSSGSWGIPSGTPINVRINENLSSEEARPGDRFTGVLTESVVVNGRAAFSRGTDVRGQVTSAKKSGRLSDPGELELVLVSIGNTNISSQPFLIKGASHTNVGKIGGGTAAGAIIGGIVGGGKGAAIGAGVGAGAGTATAAATGVKPAKVESEAILTFVSAGSAAANANSGYNDYRHGHEGHDDYADRKRSHHDDDEDDDDDHHHDRRSRDDGYSFGDRDREILGGCLSSYNFESLPPGIQKKLARGGSLPPGQAKKLRALPDSCTVRLPRLPRNVERIIFGDRVILLEDGNHILDMVSFGR
jgi:outer membrane lipoprotein SlyB